MGCGTRLRATRVAFLIALIAASARIAYAQNCTLSAQKAALLKLYDLTGGSGWLQNKPGWRDNSSLDICTWFGVSCCSIETCTAGDSYCVCTIGLVSGLYLQGNNLTGSMIIGSTSTSDAQLITSALGCSLLEIEAQNNNLSGSLPSLTSISHLRLLNLGSNKLTGSLPSAIGSLTALIALDISENQLTGAIPQDICYLGGPMSDLDLAGNRFTGSLDLSLCNNLVFIDVSRNTNITGSVIAPTGFNRLHVVYLSNTKIRDVSSLVTRADLISDFDLDMTSFNGSLPSSYLEGFRFLNRLSIRMNPFVTGNALRGTLPPGLFQIGTLRQLDLSNNLLSGSLPAFGDMSSLTSLVLSNNGLSGTLPPSMINVFSAQTRFVDLRYNFMSCCGVGSLQGSFSSGSAGYASYNLSAPRLPDGVKFSANLQPVQALLGSGAKLNLGNSSYSGLNCPYLLPSGATDVPSNYLSWMLDPEYYLFEGCQCSSGLAISYKSFQGLWVPQCSQPSSQQGWWIRYYWIFIIIGVVIIALVLLVLWHGLNGHRPLVIQNILDAQKRAKGPPTMGMISIVTTDIEGFSDLMKSSPELMMPALLIHNNLIQKAKFANFGYTIEQEGDAYSIVFEKSSDAVKFCLQAQLLLAKQKWPKGLFRHSELRGTLMKETSKVKRMGRGIHEATSRVFATVESWMGGKTGSAMFKRAAGEDITQEDIQRLRGTYGSEAGTEADLKEEEEGGVHRSANSATSSKAPSDMTGFHSSFASSAGGLAAEANFAARVRLAGSAVNGVLGGSPQESFTSEAAPNLGPSVKGLKVRMGIATGVLPQGRSPAGSHILELAKIVGDAGAGGQILMCSNTFSQVKDLTEEFGCVTEAGLRRDMMEQRNPFKSLWQWWTGTEDVNRGNEAVLLDMGQFMHCKDGSEVPNMLTAADLVEKKEEVQYTLSGKMKAPVEDAPIRQLARNLSRSFTASNKVAPGPLFQKKAKKLIRLYQILSPSLIERGRLFGSKLALKDEWVKVDSSYFDAPGTLNAALSPNDQVLGSASSGMPFIGMVFCLIEGGKAYASKHRADASIVHNEMVAIIKSTKRQIPQGYFVRSQDGDLKYLVAFSTAEAALFWCISMQMICMYHKWPSSAHKQWPEERGPNGALLFRGPRLKMGMCEGYANSVLPDHLGRADYHGSSINQAARFMDAAAHGGQVACLESTALKVADEWRRISSSFFDGNDGFRNFGSHKDDVDDSEDAGAASYAPEECTSVIFGSRPTSFLDAAEAAIAAVDAENAERESDEKDKGKEEDPMVSPFSMAPEVKAASSSGLLDRTKAMAHDSHDVSLSEGSGSNLKKASIRFREKESSFKIIDDSPLDLTTLSLRPPVIKSRFAELKALEVNSGDNMVARAASSGILKRPKFVEEGNGLTSALMGLTSEDPYADLGPTASSHGLNPVGPLGSPNPNSRLSILKMPTGLDRMVQAQNADVLPVQRSSSGIGNGNAKVTSWQMPEFDMMVHGNQIEVTAVRVGEFKFKGSPEALSMVNMTPTALLGRRYPADPPKGKGGRVGETSGVAVEVVIPMMKCMAQFEDDNQYAIHVAPDTEEPTDAAGMMHSLAGLVAQSVSAAFFRAPARSASISSSQSRGVDDAVGRDELAVTQSGHSTYSAASGHSNMSEADRTMSAVEAIRAEERKKKLAEMNAAKAANPSSSAINLGLQRSGSDFAKSAGRLKFSDEGEVLDGIQAGPSASKLGNVKFDDEGASRVASGVKFNEGEVDLEKGQGQGLLPKPPSRPMSARSKGGLKKVSTINERDVSRDDDPPLLDRVRSRELQSFSSTGNQRKLFSLGSNDERV